MTREEAIAVLSDRDNFLWWEMSKAERECYSKVFDMAISALSENNGDLISRQAVDDAIYDYSRSCDVNYAQIMKYIDKIPSVENKCGEWHDDGFCGDYVCSVCNQEFDSDIPNMRGFDFDLPKFCPNCGAKMKRW